ncbi:MAG: helix-turn-helix domain-containing protein [Rhodobacteraceae bacterium]|nr:helix-turn-helix domain-containing protein [Paracoccaceae bacterium]
MNDTETLSNKAQNLQSKHNCPLCNNKDIKLEWVDHKFDYGTGDNITEIETKVPVLYCEICDIEYLDREGGRIKHEAICKHHGVLTPSEIKELRKSYGYTQEGFAKVTKFGIASLNRWERGASIQSPASDNYLRLLYDPRNMDHLEKRLIYSTMHSEPEDSKKFPFLSGSNLLLTLQAKSYEFQLITSQYH